MYTDIGRDDSGDVTTDPDDVLSCLHIVFTVMYVTSVACLVVTKVLLLPGTALKGFKLAMYLPWF
jgi:hypothetical protein